MSESKLNRKYKLILGSGTIVREELDLFFEDCHLVARYYWSGESDIYGYWYDPYDSDDHSDDHYDWYDHEYDPLSYLEDLISRVEARVGIINKCK